MLLRFHICDKAKEIFIIIVIIITQTFLALSQVLHLLCILLLNIFPGNVPLLVPTLTF